MAINLNKRVSPSRKHAFFEDWFTLGQLYWRKEKSVFGSLQVYCLSGNSPDNLPPTFFGFENSFPIFDHASHLLYMGFSPS